MNIYFSAWCFVGLTYLVVAISLALNGAEPSTPEAKEACGTVIFLFFIVSFILIYFGRGHFSEDVRQFKVKIILLFSFMAVDHISIILVVLAFMITPILIPFLLWGMIEASLKYIPTYANRIE